ncbi:MAG: PHP domain-containing protein [Deltaproteobacteria bacterium]|nr:PHP domain-containing protein [Deltaproteobacteria bacterium]
MIDLHTHSTASDGSLAPAALVRAAAEAGLRGIALTDHDTVAGVAQAAAEARKRGVPFIAGMEISAKPERGSMHILGYHVDARHPHLLTRLNWLVERRNERNVLIARKLNGLGLDVSLEEVRAAAGGGVVGRPHFARVMIAKGHVKSEAIAFKKYLDRSGLAYVEKDRLDPEECLGLVRAAGGVPVLAHPDQTKAEGGDLERLVRRLVGLGLAGIEVHYPGYSRSRIAEYSELARKYGLVLTGGSDFHGGTKPGCELGRGRGTLRVPDDLLGPLAEAARRVREGRAEGT